MSDLIQAADALTRMAILLGIETETNKSIASVARKFHANLRNAAVVGFTSSGSVLGIVRNLVKDAVRDAYIEGLAEGDIPADEMTEDDAAAIDALVDEQVSFVTDFVKAIREARDDKAMQRQILDTRIELWTASIEAAGMAGLASAKANEMVVWRLGETEEHCKTCNRLDGQRHRRKWFADRNYFPQTPGAALECGGFNCACTLE